MESEVHVGYVTGWRWWLLDAKTSQPHPCSIGLPYRWKWTGENSTDGLRMANRRGFYAYDAAGIETIFSGGPLLFGRVALYGEVVVHKQGYRAEKARILDAWCAPEWWDKLRAVRQVKGIFEIVCQGGEEWLKLETRTALSDIIPSASPTMSLRTRSRIQ